MITPSGICDRKVRDAVLSNFARVRHLYMPSIMLRTDNDDIHPTLVPIIESPAPNLETLFVYKVPTSIDCFPMPHIFKNCTPRLTTLKLCYAIPEPGCISTTNLTHLYIRGKKRAPIKMEIARFLEVLRACPSLEVLRTIKMKVVPCEEELSIVRLEKLQFLDIARCSATVVSDIIRHLVIPPCTMRLSASLERSPNFVFHFGIPAKLDAEHPLRDIRRLHVKYKSAYNAVVLEGLAGKRHHPFDVNATIGTALSDISDVTSIAGSLLWSISQTLDLTSCEEFIISETHYLHPHTGFSRKTWSDVLRQMPQLKALHVRVQSLGEAGFIRAVISALSRPDEITDKLLCPLLETLTIEEDRTWSALQCYAMAEDRACRGQPIKKISLRLPHYENLEDMDDSDLAILRRVINIVDLDPPEISVPEFPAPNW